jgi:hypothetical protein
MPAGRPTVYDPKFIDILNGMGDEGEGMAEAWAALGIGRQSFYDFQKQYPEFSDAVNGMKARSQAWWERNGRLATFGMREEAFNATAFIFNMKNRFGDDWREKSEVEQKVFNVTIDGDDKEL